MRVDAVTLCACFCEKPRFEFPRETYEDETIFAVLSGSFEYAMGDGVWHRIGGGQCVFCPRGETFHRRMLSPSTFALLHFRSGDPLPDGGEPITPGNARRFREDIEHLLRHPLCFSPEEEPEIALFARDLLWLATEPSSSVPAALAAIRSRMAEHPEEDFETHRLAREAGYTEAQFIRLFHRYFGDTPKQCLLTLRMDKAKLLLRSTDLPVSEVAFHVGYTDPLYFSRLFHRRTGYTPRVWRTLGGC